jgi:hypothetical protein
MARPFSRACPVTVSLHPQPVAEYRDHRLVPAERLARQREFQFVGSGLDHNLAVVRLIGQINEARRIGQRLLGDFDRTSRRSRADR